MENAGLEFENNPEKSFWRTKILERAVEIAKDISENLELQHAEPREPIKNGPTDFLILQHVIHKGPYTAFGFHCTQEYLEDDLEDDLRQNAKMLFEDIQVLYN